MKMSNIKLLIEQSKEARQIHIDWKLIQADRKKNGLILIERVGNVEWHQRWIEYYDKIIEVLKLETKVNQAIELTEKEHPYKEAGNRNSYSEYNEGWSDCCDILGDRIKGILK